MDILSEILNKLKKLEKIKDYGFEEYLYWNNVPVIYFNNGGHIFLAKTFSRNGTTHLNTLANYKTKSILKKKIDEILLQESLIFDCCIDDLTKLEDYRK